MNAGGPIVYLNAAKVAAPGGALLKLQAGLSIVLERLLFVEDGVKICQLERRGHDKAPGLNQLRARQQRGGPDIDMGGLLAPWQRMFLDPFFGLGIICKADKEACGRDAYLEHQALWSRPG